MLRSFLIGVVIGVCLIVAYLTAEGPGERFIYTDF